MKVSEEYINQLTDYFEQITYQFKAMETSCVNILTEGITLQELQVIVFLGKHGPSKMSDIADEVMASASNLTAIIDKLVAKNVALRQRSESDRRIVLVALNDSGKTIFSTYRNIKRDHSRNLLARLSEEDQSTYLDLMAKVVACHGDDDPLGC